MWTCSTALLLINYLVACSTAIDEGTIGDSIEDTGSILE